MTEFEVDTHHFKVICQRCGKTGYVDFDKSGKENGFVLMFGDYEYIYEFWLCLDCCYELMGDEEDSGDEGDTFFQMVKEFCSGKRRFWLRKILAEKVIEW